MSLDVPTKCLLGFAAWQMALVVPIVGYRVVMSQTGMQLRNNYAYTERFKTYFIRFFF